MSESDIKKIEEVLGFEFKDKRLLAEAFTHSTYSNEHNSKSNERLEFFGDAVLSFIVSDYLYKNIGDKPEGTLTTIRKDIVKQKTLSDVTKKLGLHEFILLGEGEKKKGAHELPKLQANLFEALLAAVYLDKGLKTASDFVIKACVEHIDFEKGDDNYKGELKELLEKNYKKSKWEYEVLSDNKNPKRPEFEIGFRLNGKLIATAKGSRKIVAEQECSRLALEQLSKRQPKLPNE
jgi:ribonuclease-3